MTFYAKSLDFEIRTSGDQAEYNWDPWKGEMEQARLLLCVFVSTFLCRICLPICMGGTAARQIIDVNQKWS